MPTTPAYTVDNDILKSTDPDRELKVAYKLLASTYYQKGAALVDAGGGTTLRPVPANGGSTGTPVALMPINGMTDASGNFTPGTPATATQFGVTYPSYAVLTGGTFKASDLISTSTFAGAIHANHFVPGGPQNTGWTLHGSITNGWIEK